MLSNFNQLIINIENYIEKQVINDEYETDIIINNLLYNNHTFDLIVNKLIQNNYNIIEYDIENKYIVFIKDNIHTFIIEGKSHLDYSYYEDEDENEDEDEEFYMICVEKQTIITNLLRIL